MKNLDKPRWPGGPMICQKENLPAFVSAAALAEFHEANAPGVKVIKKAWLCDHCEGWHHFAGEAPPAGATSGNSRPGWNEPDGAKNESGWKPWSKKGPFLRASTEKEMDDRRRAQQGLDKPNVKPERSVKLPRAKKPEERGLF